MLDDLLQAAGLKPSAPPPRPDGKEAAEELLRLYADLGGLQAHPVFRPGKWDLSYAGLVVELDEELHFNRYRARSLETSWSTDTPWRNDYLRACRERESDCLRAGQWGARWTSP